MAPASTTLPRRALSAFRLWAPLTGLEVPPPTCELVAGLGPFFSYELLSEIVRSAFVAVVTTDDPTRA